MMRNRDTMTYSTLITPAELAPHLGDPAWAIVDCRFDLFHVEWGQQAYRAAHIPGAVYAHLDRDLSGPKTGRNGRHPLPDWNVFMRRLGEWGIGPGVQVVAYDQDSGMYASRLWWMLRYLGHPAVAVLDGGLARWQREGQPAASGEERRAPAAFAGRPRPEMIATAADVDRLRQDPAYAVLDARSPERFRGETEPLDPVAGRIPGARNHFSNDSLQADGTFLPPESLRARLLERLGGVPPENVVSYCGSGVAACQNLLALEVAGLPGGRLYPGSYSEWCADPARAIGRGT
jgi:thiosulfate/3-mercaptopyruvate sulfurtransferase